MGCVHLVAGRLGYLGPLPDGGGLFNAGGLRREPSWRGMFEPAVASGLGGNLRGDKALAAGGCGKSRPSRETLPRSNRFVALLLVADQGVRAGAAEMPSAICPGAVCCSLISAGISLGGNMFPERAFRVPRPTARRHGRRRTCAPPPRRTQIRAPDRAATFRLINDVTLMGGYAGPVRHNEKEHRDESLS